MMTIREYKRVESLEEAWELNQKKANRVIGGMIWLKMSRGNVGTAIDISGLGLDQIEETEDTFEIGAMVTLRQLEEHPGLAAYTDGAMRESVRHIVGVQLRNLATVGGSIYGRFGFSDVLTMFLAMDTEVELYKAGRMPLVEFAKQIGGRDILVKLIVHKDKAVYHYQSVRNTQTDFPVLTCAAAKRADGAYRFSIGARPGRAVLFEASAETIQALIEEKQKAETKADADADTRESQDKTQTGKKAACLAKWICDQVQTSSNMRGSAEYRKHLTGVLIKRAVRVLEEC